MVKRSNKIMKKKGNRKNKVTSNDNDDDSRLGPSNARSHHEPASVPAKKKKKPTINSGNKRKSKNISVSSSNDEEEIVIESSGDEEIVGNKDRSAAKPSSSNKDTTPKYTLRPRNINVSSSNNAEEEVVIDDSNDSEPARPSKSTKKISPFLYQKHLRDTQDHIILRPPAFKFIQPKNGIPKLYIFDTNDSKLCYTFSRARRHSTKYRCLACHVKSHKFDRSEDDKQFIVNLYETRKGEFYVRMARDKKHCCEPIPYPYENIFELQPGGKKENGTMIIYVNPEDKNLFYEYAYRPSLKTYFCCKCFKEHKHSVTAKINTNEKTGEMYLILGKKEHLCTPQMKSEADVLDVGSPSTSVVVAEGNEVDDDNNESDSKTSTNLKRKIESDEENDNGSVDDDVPPVHKRSKLDESTSMDIVIDENDLEKPASDNSIDDEEAGPSNHSMPSIETNSIAPPSIYHFEKASTTKLNEICEKLNIRYRNKVSKLWDKIIFNQIDTVSPTPTNIQTHYFETDNFYQILSIFFTGKSKQHQQIQATIIEAFREKLVSSGQMSTKEFDKNYLDTVTEGHFDFIAKFLSCRILIFDGANGIKKYGKWKLSTSTRLTLVVALIDGYYSIVLNL